MTDAIRVLYVDDESSLLDIGKMFLERAGNFEVTFTSQDLTSVPLIMRWKDAVGNDYSVTKKLNLGSDVGNGGNSSASRTSGSTSVGAGGAGRTGGNIGGASLFSASRGGGISSFYPVIAAGILIVAGIVLYIKRKWLIAKFKKQ